MPGPIKRAGFKNAFEKFASAKIHKVKVNPIIKTLTVDAAKLVLVTDKITNTKINVPNNSEKYFFILS